MKNKTAFIILLLTNMFLLAHAVVPHHHHTNSPLEIAVECNHHEEHSHQGKVPFCDDEHQDHETTVCSLNQIMVVPNNQFKEIIESVDLEFTDIPFLAVVLDFNYSYSSDRSDSPPEVAKNSLLYSRLLVSSQGLRAPPVC